MRGREEFINEHIALDQSHRLDFLYQTEGAAMEISLACLLSCQNHGAIQRATPFMT